MSRIRIANVRADETTVRTTIEPTSDLRRFFGETEFLAEYGVDVSNVHESILAIPAVAHVCPVAWANGATVEVPTLDGEFESSLAAVERSLQSMYPEFMEGGQVRVETTVDSPDRDALLRNDRSGRVSDGGSNVGVLFSGGVDSVTTFVRHRDEQPTLISVQGWTFGTDDLATWGDFTDHVDAFADRHGVDTKYVRSNMLDVLDMPMLQAHYKRYLVGSWYSGVGHGLGLLGLCAPLTRPENIRRLYIASTHTEAFGHPWGSHPSLDDHVQWDGTTAKHDGFELDRQEKVEAVSAVAAEADSELSVLTCNDALATNCSRCEKCSRTIAAFALAGADPNDLGYDVAPDTFDRIRERLVSGDWLVDEDVLFMWKNIQHHVNADAADAADAGLVADADADADGDTAAYTDASIAAHAETDPDVVGDADVPGADEFFEWLGDADLDAWFQQSETGRGTKLVRAVARRTPYAVYSKLYPVYDTVRERLP